MRQSLGSGLLRLGFLAACAFAGGALSTHLAAATSEVESPYAILRQLARVLVVVEREYVDPVERDRLLEGSIKGMVAELDPHSGYMPPEDFAILQGDTRGEFGGVGVEVDFRNDTVTVITPIEGSPAQRAGIRPGDRILAIDGIQVRGKSSSELVRRMRGQPGTKVRIRVRREAEDKLLNFTLTREVISVASIASKTLDGGLAYLRIKQFQNGTHGELLTALGKLKAEGPVRGVLLDLRNNPGGLVDEATAVADELLAGGIIYSTRHRGTTVDEVTARGRGALRREPLVVLVNEYSASAAELVAGALQDHRRGTVVGAPTFGKGSVQTILDLPGGAGLRLTTMRYYTPGGHAIQARGIRPDVPVELAGSDRPAMRESDLENHLPAEGALAPRQRASDRIAGEASEERAGDDTEDARHDDTSTVFGVARDIPSNPTDGPDTALSVGYQLLKELVKSHAER